MFGALGVGQAGAALVRVIDIATGAVVAEHQVPPTEEIGLEPGQYVFFPEVPFGDAENPDVILDVIEDTDIQVTFEEGTVTIKNLYLLLEQGENVLLAFSDFESGGVMSSLDDFLATSAGPGHGAISAGATNNCDAVRQIREGYITASGMLFPGEPQREKLALYSYLLFTNDDSSGKNYDRRIAAITAYVGKYRTLAEEAINEQCWLPEEVISFIVPLEQIDLSRNYALNRVRIMRIRDKEGDQELINTIDKNYSYKRSYTMIDNLNRELPENMDGYGPFIVSSTVSIPFDTNEFYERNITSENVVVQDFSSTSPKLVGSEIMDFRTWAVQEVKNESDFWFDLAKRTRNLIADGGEKLDVVGEAAAKLVSFPGF